jgi:hypothetical protein
MAGSIAKLGAKYRDKGFVVYGPTQRYGYTTRRSEKATPEQEMAHIKEVLAKSYTGLGVEMTVPVSEKNLLDWGCSTSPTVVLVDRTGIVRMYHPGQMTEEELEPRIKALVESGPTAAN